MRMRHAGRHRFEGPIGAIKRIKKLRKLPCKSFYHDGNDGTRLVVMAMATVQRSPRGLRLSLPLLLPLLLLPAPGAAPGYVYQEVFGGADGTGSGECADASVNRLCTTNRNGGVTASLATTCVGRNDVSHQ
jgi:hypothetical protein